MSFKSLFFTVAALVYLIALATAANAAAGLSQIFPVTTITLSTTPVASISPLIYGVNYVWATVPQSQFQAWVEETQGPAVFSKLNRYPGGWDGEWYDWLNWQTDNGFLAGSTIPYSEPGVTPATFLAETSVPATFMLPTKQVIEMPAKATQAQLDAETQALVSQYLQQIAQFGNQVQYWEIGNEWWFQNGAGSHPDKLPGNLARYAQIVTEAVPDWFTAGTDDDQFRQLMQEIGGNKLCGVLFGKGSAQLASCNNISNNLWAHVDGIAIHSYCGTIEQPLCSSIQQRVQTIMSETGKDDIYASEWSVVHDLSIPAGQTTTTDFGIQNASSTVFALSNMTLAGIKEAAYWPALGSVPNIALVSNAYSPVATGIAFGWISQYYQGQAYQTSGDIPAVAASNEDRVTVIIPTGAVGGKTVRLLLKGTGLTHVVSAEVMSSATPDGLNTSENVQVSQLPFVYLPGPEGGLSVDFTVNLGTPGRGSNWEIARITLDNKAVLPPGLFIANLTTMGGTVFYSNGSHYCSFSCWQDFLRIEHLGQEQAGTLVASLPTYLSRPVSMFYDGPCD